MAPRARRMKYVIRAKVQKREQRAEEDVTFRMAATTTMNVKPQMMLLNKIRQIYKYREGLGLFKKLDLCCYLKL